MTSVLRSYRGRLGPSGPTQYGPEGVCKCGAKLSCYNPYSVCGPCRRTQVVFGTVTNFRSDRRRPTGRGPLLAETLNPWITPAELPEPDDDKQAPCDPIPVEDAPC